ncbi:MAG: beta propeller repeat protein [Bacilli bacterium]
MFKTDNGGNNWSQVMLTTNKTVPMSSAFATPKRGWMTGEVLEQISNKSSVTAEVLQVYTTAVGGKNWTVQYTLNSPFKY